MKGICSKGLIRSLIGYNSYQNKKETIYNEYEVDVPRSTILYHEQRESDTLIDYLLSQQYQRMKEQGYDLLESIVMMNNMFS